MRNILLTLMLVLTLTACGGKEDVPTDPAGETATTEQAAESATAEEDAAQTDDAAKTTSDDKSIVDADIMTDPMGEVHLADGRVLELSKLEKIGKYYMYITGKLNGRSSTVISFTRLDDIRHWKGISFTDPHNFSIVNGQDKELRFEQSRIYIGSDSADTFTFYTLDSSGFDIELTTVNKRDVKLIAIAPKKEDN